jgi:gas vesicle protein
MYNNQKLTVMEKREIIVSVVKSNKSDNNVWAVAITGDEQPSAHCKSAYKAMRFMFLLKKQTGLYIADASLSQLSQEIARVKAEQAEAGKEKIAEVTEEFIETHSVDAVLASEPEKKAKRKPRTKKNVETAAVPQ